ncbi:MAG: RecX family transcriptional regulator [Chloroflexi bacterium]|nr:RecX family transcriptional regulator [Chloroflexota bacterium]MBP8055225.1 RecX family transcriptional regulator [Chloroflexota bacterium]
MIRDSFPPGDEPDAPRPRACIHQQQPLAEMSRLFLFDVGLRADLTRQDGETKSSQCAGSDRESDTNMPTITAITAQVKNKDRVNIFLDEQYAFSLSLAAATGLKTGDNLTEEQIALRQSQDLLVKAKEQVIRLISQRPRSIGEVQRYLHGKGYDNTQIEQVITQLQALDLLNDSSFSEYWIDQRLTFKPRSQMALRYELQQKGVSRDVIDSLLNEVDEVAAARDAAQRKLGTYRHLPQEQFRAKLGGYLQRRGFQYQTIRQVVDDLWRELEDEP